VPPHRLADWARRKRGELVVFKQRSDPEASVGCGHPCPVCRKALERAGLGIVSIVSDESLAVYRGPASRAPPSRPTAKQRGCQGWA